MYPLCWVAAGLTNREKALSERYSQALGERLRAVRTSQRLSLQAVEDRSAGRWKAVVVGSYERGDRAISVTRLADLANFYELPIAALLPKEDEVTGEPAAIVVLDLVKLGELAAHQTGSPARYLATVRRHTDNHGGRVLTIWNEHVKVFALAYDVHPGELTDQLIEWAVRAPRPAGEGEGTGPKLDLTRAGDPASGVTSAQNVQPSGHAPPPPVAAAASAVVAEAVAIAAEAQTRIAAEMQAEATALAVASAAAVAEAADRTAQAAEKARAARTAASATAAQAVAATAAQTAAAVQMDAQAATARLAVAAVEAASVVAASATPGRETALTASVVAAIVAAAAAENAQAITDAAAAVARAVAVAKEQVTSAVLAAEAAFEQAASLAASAVSSLADQTALRIADETTARAARTGVTTRQANAAGLDRLNGFLVAGS